MSSTNLLNQIQEAANITLNNAQEAKKALAEAKALSVTINNEQAVIINEGKELIRQALIRKGQTVSRSLPFNQYASKIDAIEGGSSEATNQSSNFIKGFDGDGKFLYRIGSKLGGDNKNLSLLTNIYNFDSNIIYDYSKLKNRKFKSFSISNTGNFALMIGTDKNLYAINYGNNPGSFLKFSNMESLEPICVDDSGNWKKVYIDNTESFVFNENDELYVCGVNNVSKFGLNGDRNIWTKRKIEVDGVSKWEKVADYGECAFYLSKNGRLFVAGKNTNGVLGLDSTDNYEQTSLKEIIVDGVSSWKDIEMYNSNACAISSNGKLYVWGDNYYDQLEQDTADPYDIKEYHYEHYNYNPSNLNNMTFSYNEDKSVLTISGISDPNDYNGTYEKIESSNIVLYRKQGEVDGNFVKNYISIYQYDNNFYVSFYKEIRYKSYYHEFNINSSDPYDLSAIDSENFTSESLEISEDKNTITLTPDFSNNYVTCESRFYDYPLHKISKNGVFAYYESTNQFGCQDFIHFIEIIKISDTQFTWKIGMFRENSNGDMDDFYGNKTSRSRTAYKPKQIGTNKTWKKACFGENYLLALTQDGELYSCGWNRYGRTGQGVNNDNLTSTLTRIGTKSDWKDIFIGSHDNEFLAIDSENKVFFNGYNALQYGGRVNRTNAVCSPLWTGLKFDSSVEFSTTFEYFLANEDLDYTDYQIQLYNIDRSNQIKLIIPNDVTHISNFLFDEYYDDYYGNTKSNSNYRYIFIPKEVTQIDENAFISKSSNTNFKLLFEASSEEVKSMENYPWGLDAESDNFEDIFFMYNCEFEKIPDGGQINYLIENNFPDDFIYYVAEDYPRINNIQFKEIYFLGKASTEFWDSAMIENCSELKKITFTSVSSYGDEYCEGDIIYNCPNIETVICKWTEGTYYAWESNLKSCVPDGCEIIFEP